LTRRELAQLYYLEKEIQMLQGRIQTLEQEIESCTQTLTGMPKSGNGRGKIADIAAELVDMKRLLDLKRQERIYTRNRIIRYIQEIKDSEARMIIEYRFIDHLSWRQVAKRMGGYATAASVKMI